MNRSDFIALVTEELDLPLSDDDLTEDFDRVLSWDSMHALRLARALEAETGRRLRIAEILSARSLGEIYQQVAS